MNTLKIIPYCKQDGIRTFRDSDVMGFYDRMEKDGTHKIVFYAGHINSRESFLRYMKDPGTLLYVLIIDNDIVGVTWLDGIEDKSAFDHFCIFSEFWGQDTVALGKTVLKMLTCTQYEGEYVFDLFKGMVPAWNQRAVDFAVACGGVNLGVVPNGIWNEGKKKSEDAVFIYYTREVM